MQNLILQHTKIQNNPIYNVPVYRVVFEFFCFLFKYICQTVSNPQRVVF